MCVCVPAAAPFLLPLLEGILAALWALAPFLLPLATVLLGAVFLTVRGTVRAISWPVVAWLERRSDRLHNEAMAAKFPQLRPQLEAAGAIRALPAPPRLAIEAPRLLAIEATRLPVDQVRIYATPREELTR